MGRNETFRPGGKTQPNGHFRITSAFCGIQKLNDTKTSIRSLIIGWLMIGFPKKQRRDPGTPKH